MVTSRRRSSRSCFSGPLFPDARSALLACALLLFLPAASTADWLITPFVGLKLDGSTNLVDIDQSAGAARLTVGGSFGFLGDSILGIEADLGHTPGFFDSDARGRLVANSRVTTLTGNVLLTTPIRLTRESLRPYVVAGLGVIYVNTSDLLEIFSIGTRFVGLDVGGGAIGSLTNRTSLRFELRRFQNLGDATGTAATFGPSRLSFWRATAGLAFRY